MRLLSLSLFALVLTACGKDEDADSAGTTDTDTTVTGPTVTEDAFLEQYADQFCTMLVDCGSEFSCVTTTPTTTPTTTTSTCDYDYDPVAAAECLNGEWTCGEDGIPIVPEVCGSIYSGCTTTTL